MKKNKAIKKPHFLGVFLIRLLCAWLIAAICGIGLYYYSNSVYVRKYNEEKEKVIESVDEAYEAFYLNTTTRSLSLLGSEGEGDQYLQFYNNEKTKLAQKLAVLYAQGIYCETQMGEWILTPPGADEGNTTLLYYEHNKKDVYDTASSAYLLPIPFDQLDLECEGDSGPQDFGLADSAPVFSELDENMAFSYVNEERVVPLWLFTDDDESESGQYVRFGVVSDLVTDEANMTFLPLTLILGDYKWALKTDVTKIIGNDYYYKHGYLGGGNNAMLIRYPEASEHHFDTVIDKSNLFVGSGYLPDGSEEYTDYDLGSIVTELNGKYEIRMDYPDTGSLWEKDHSGVIVKNFCLWLFIAAVVALVISLISYSRKRAVYEIFEYRRKVTDSLAHDLKTPLMAISAFSETLDECNDKEQSRDLTSKIRENVATMNNMVEGVLDFSKSDRELGRVNKSDVNISKLVRKETDTLKSLFDKRGVKVAIKSGDDVIIKSNEEIMKRSVMNLLTNAAKFATPGSTVDIEITSFELKIKDQTKEVIENIKDIKKPFVKGSSSRGGENGTGLGLAIADSSLTALGHSLDVDLKDGIFTAVIKW